MGNGVGGWRFVTLVWGTEWIDGWRFVTLVWETGGRFVTLVLGKGEVGVVIQVLEDGWVR